jgi:hypothetical protein
VSAIHHIGEVVTHFKNTWNRNGMEDDGSAFKACVHGSSTEFNAYWYPGSPSNMGFRQATGSDGPSVAALDVVGHEYMHGIEHDEVGFVSYAGDGPELGEALPDYFGARINQSPCIAGDVYGAGCLRRIDTDSTWSELMADSACAADPHCRGRAFASSLWLTSVADSGSYATETDHSTYHAMLYYMTPILYN